MTNTLAIKALPDAVYTGQSVRFFPYFSSYDGVSAPLVKTYTWDFGDGTSGITGGTPIHIYTNASTITTHTVTCVATYPDSTTISATMTVTVMGTGDTVPTFPTDGTYQLCRLILIDKVNKITKIIKRVPWDACTLRLLSPTTTDSLDKVGTLKCQVLDVGNITATETSLLIEGTDAIFVCGEEITFSGTIRRVTQNTQNGFSSTAKVKLYDIEIDSDLYRLNNLPVDSTALSTDGSAFLDTPGNLARRFLKPATGERDTRGIINCVDARMSYTLNSSAAESAGSRYEHLMAVQASSNYDVRTRPDTLIFPYVPVVYGWQPNPQPTGIIKVVSMGGDNFLALSGEGLIWQSANGGFIWSQVGTVEALSNDIYYSSTICIIVAMGYLFSFDLTTQEYTILAQITDFTSVAGAYFEHICFMGGTTFVVTIYNSTNTLVIKTTDNGEHWSQVGTISVADLVGIASNLGFNSTDALVATCSETYANGGGCYTSTNGGVTWARTSSYGEMGGIAYFNMRFYVGYFNSSTTMSYIMTSNLTGTTWSVSLEVGDTAITYIQPDPNEEHSFYIGAGGYPV